MLTLAVLAACTALTASDSTPGAGAPGREAPGADAPAPGGGAAARRVRDVRLDLAFGMVVTQVPPVRVDEELLGRPVVVGMHLGYYWNAWAGAELSGDYQFDIHRWHLLAGPRLRFRWGRLLVAGGAQVGVMEFESRWVGEFDARRMRLGVSPEAGVELELGAHALLGARYAFDLPLRPHPIVGHRIMLTEGWRF